MHDSFILGVNYWPRSSAMNFWKRFDRSELEKDFAQIAALGMSLVRIFLLWEDFQPRPDDVEARQLERLRTVCEVARAHGLELDVTFFTGHMSGPNWAPAWLLGGSDPVPDGRRVVSGGEVVPSRYRNPFVDPVALAAEELLVREVVGALRSERNVRLWNLGNEPDLFAVPPDAARGRSWVRNLTQLIHALDPGRPVTCGLHVPSLSSDNGLRVHDVFAETDWAVMHAYPMYVPWSRSPLDPDVVPFTCALTSALCGKPVLMEEFGGATLTDPAAVSGFREWQVPDGGRRQFLASEADMANYIAAVLPRLVDVGATGAVLWCFADYVPELWQGPPCDYEHHERHFGLVRADGSLKPHAEVVREFARSAPRVQPARKTVSLDITPEQYYQAPDEHLERLFSAYVAEAR